MYPKFLLGFISNDVHAIAMPYGIDLCNTGRPNDVPLDVLFRMAFYNIFVRSIEEFFVYTKWA